MSKRRLAILDAAARLISQQGFTHTSADDVIREAGLSGKSHFYHYFPSKEALGFEVLDRQFGRFADRGLAILREPMLEPLDRLSLFIDTLVALQRERDARNGSPFGNLAGELADSHEGFRKRLDVVFERWAQQLQSLLWELHDQLREGVDTARLARFIIAALEGGMLMTRVTRDVAVMEGIGADLKRFVATHLRDGELILRTVAERELAQSASGWSVQDAVGEADPEGRFYDSFLDDEIVRAIDALPDEYRTALVLSDIQEMRYAEIAQILGIPEGTVKSRLFRGRRLLQRKLRGYAEEMGYIKSAPLAMAS